MSWGRDDGRKEIERLLAAIERQASDAVMLADRAQRDIADNRFSSFVDFNRKVEEVRALVTLTEDRLSSLRSEKLPILRAEFERIDLLLTGLLARATRSYFESMPDNQALPLGARELFAPELRNIGEMRAKLTRSQFEGKVPASVIEDLEVSDTLIRKTMARAPSLPDFSDAPSAPKPRKRLTNLGRPIRN